MSKEHLIGKLDRHPYGLLLKFAVNRTLEANPFTKAEGTAQGVTSGEFDQYAPSVLEERDGRYFAKFNALQDYLGYVEMATTKKNANTALVVAILSILMSMIVALPPLIKKDNPVELTSSQLQELVKAAEQPVKLADSPLPVKLEDGQLNQLMRKDEKQPSFFPPKKK